MGNPARKTYRAKRDSRRAQTFKLSLPGIVECPQCHEMKMAHNVIDSFMASSIACNSEILQISIFSRYLFQLSTGHLHFDFPYVQKQLSLFPANLIFLQSIFPSPVIQSRSLGIIHSLPFIFKLVICSTNFELLGARNCGGANRCSLLGSKW